jgi:hypothetical protein
LKAKAALPLRRDDLSYKFLTRKRRLRFKRKVGRSESEKQIPRANPALGMTTLHLAARRYEKAPGPPQNRRALGYKMGQPQKRKKSGRPFGAKAASG